MPTTRGTPPERCHTPRVDAQILLVEDDPSIREVTALGLRAAGFTVDDRRRTASRAWIAGARTAPTSSCSTSCCPRLDGLEVCRAIRRESTTPIVMLTARGDTIDVVVGLESGADDYVRKPFEMPELVARVRAALRRRTGDADADGAAGRTAIVLLGDLRIDLAGRTVDARRRDIPLTRTEFDLLVELARHPGQVFTRDRLLDRVWGYDYLGDSRLVDVAVGRLRAKVEADPAAPGAGPDGSRRRLQGRATDRLTRRPIATTA